MLRLFGLAALWTFFCAALYGQQSVFPPGSTSSGAAVVACAGNPGNTVAGYRVLCQTAGTTPIQYQCANSGGCTVAADWFATGGAASSGTNTLQKSNGSGGFSSSSCTDAGTTVVCTEPISTTGGISSGSSPPPICTGGTAGCYALGAGTVPTNYPAVGTVPFYGDSTSGFMISNLNGPFERAALLFFGTAAPTSVAGNLPGDFFSDTTNNKEYQCNAAFGTAAPACTSVTAGGWTLLNTPTGTPATTTALCLQYNDAGAFGCVPDVTFSSPHTMLFGASGILDLHSAATSGLFEPGSLATGIRRVTTGTGAVSSAELSGDATTSGSNVVTNVNVNGVSYPASPSVHQTPVVTASNVATYKTLPNCVDSGGNHLNYTQSTDLYSCGFTSSGGGGGTGTSITSVTPVTVNTNTTSDQQLMELSMPAGYFNSAEQPFLFNGAGVYSTQTVQTPTITFKVKLCTVSGCGSGTVVTLVNIVTTATIAAVTNNNWNLNFMGYTATTGATGNLEIHGPVSVDLGAITATADSIFNDVNTAVSSNIDLTAALFVDFTIAFSTNGATANTLTQRAGGIMPFAATAAPVTSVAGDGLLYSSTPATGAAALSPLTIAAHKFIGNNTGSTAAFGAQSIGTADLPAIPLSGLATQAADTVVMNASGSTAAPTAVALPTSGTNGCAGASNALTYNTTTHAYGCNSISGGSSLTTPAISGNSGNSGAAAFGGGVEFLSPGIGPGSLSTVEYLVQIPISGTGHLVNMLVTLSGTQPSTGNYVATVRTCAPNAAGTCTGVNSALTATQAASGTATVLTSTGSVAVTAGDLISVSVVNNATATATTFVTAWSVGFSN